MTVGSPDFMMGQVPNDGTPIVLCIPPPSGGGLAWGGVWLSFRADFGTASVRVAVHTENSGGSYRLIETLTIASTDSGKTGVTINTGDDAISLSMTPAAAAVGWLLEVGTTT